MEKKHKHSFIPYKDIDIPTGKWRVGDSEVKLTKGVQIAVDNMEAPIERITQKATIFYCTKCTKLKIRRWNEKKEKNN